MPAASIHRSHAVYHEVPWIVGQVALVSAGVLFYFGARGITGSAPATAVAHARDLLAAEHAVGADVEADLQAALLRWDLVMTLANWIYIYGHWPVIVPTLVWLAVRHREHFVRLRDAMMISGAVGLVTFAWYPVAPPRLADLCFVDTITLSSQSYRLLQPTAFVNQYAAMPSLHAGWDLLIGLSITAVAGQGWLRWVGRLLPVLMMLAVVVTGNHYVFDVIAGLAVALAGLAAAHGVERFREHARGHGSGRAAGPVAGCDPHVVTRSLQ